MRGRKAKFFNQIGIMERGLSPNPMGPWRSFKTQCLQQYNKDVHS
ncbi:hypothetical protein [Pasteuria penetrans]|nr:hypothetical protein [Pasteuria penetrans]